MSMEKQGVTKEDHAAQEREFGKEAQECARPQCCGRSSCGNDPLSKAADAVAEKSQK